MKSDKKARLQRAGWVVGDAAQFLKLSTQEQRFVELKLALATGVRQLRERRGLTQAALAEADGLKSVARSEDGSRRRVGQPRPDDAIAIEYRCYR